MFYVHNEGYSAKNLAKASEQIAHSHGNNRQHLGSNQ